MLQILLVDDLREELGFLQRTLQQCKILNPQVLLQSGQECISFFRANQSPERSARFLVFLDLVMSPVSGIAVLRHLKNLGLSEESLFVMLSGISDIKGINEGYQLGARTFMIKPVKPDDVMEVLNAMRSKIIVEERPEGYLLDWNVPVSKPTVPQTPDTAFLKKGVSLSA